MAFQDRAQGVCARLHLTAVRKTAFAGLVLVLGAVAAATALALASPFSTGEAVVVERGAAEGESADATGGIATAAPAEDGVATGEGAATADGSLPAAGATAELCVHVDGAVASPGVYRLPAGSRIVDAVEAAGGLAEGARSAGVNLAQALVDGQQVVIPDASDEALPASAPAADGGGGGLISINTASAAELTALDGIGEATAEKIVADREANGPFASIDDLKRVSGIGDKKLEALRDDVCL